MLRKFKQDYPRFKLLFPFDQFNEVQNQCYTKIFNSTGNMIISAPTSSGKTVLFQLLIAKLIHQNKSKCLYLAPIKSLCHEKATKWKSKFPTILHIMQLTGDTLQIEPTQFDHADLYIATPQKIDYISRKNLDFLKQLNLLLIDEIHMLNMQDRGAILQAIVSRIMSINKNIRIMAVSATIPNIRQVAQWLKVPKDLICIFGPQYRPAKLHKVVLGFKSFNNDFNFQKMLNFKILQIIRNYSYGKGVLIFCQTQKGTQQACNKIISQANPRQFIQNQSQPTLINAAKSIENTSLKSLIIHGVAFHNASLSMKDRSLVEKLFLDYRVKVLCTTSTLSMGVNLPARLVIIKSTKCYKGAGKGYQQYTQIELDQMMGRAGRVPFDTEGTVVIMTQKQNYSKYAGQIKLQNLQSQLYYQFIDHLNTQISLKSIQNLNQAIQYFQNSFCYIRMQNSPKNYNLNSKTQLADFVKKTCLQSIKKLAQYNIVDYLQTNQNIYPRQCSFNISKNAIQVDTIINIIKKINTVKNQRDFLQLLCSANQFSKYRSKLDQRKFLKVLNERNKFCMKQSISSSQKKIFVLIQAQMSGMHIQNWELRRQASQCVFFFKRLAYCVKSLAMERKSVHQTFWLYSFGCLYHKYFSLGFWELSHQKVLKQLNSVSLKWSNIQARGIRNLSQLVAGLNQLDTFGSNVSSANIKKNIMQQLSILKDCLQINLTKNQPSSTQNYNKQHPSINPSLTSTPSHIPTIAKQAKQFNHILKITFSRSFTPTFKSINIIIQHNQSIYHSGIINQSNKQFTVYLKNTLGNKYFIAIVKQGYVGFDEYYMCEYGVVRKTELKRQLESGNKKNNKSQSVDNCLNQNRKNGSLEKNKVMLKSKKSFFDNYQNMNEDYNVSQLSLGNGRQESGAKKKKSGNSFDSKIKSVNKKINIKNSIKTPREIKFIPNLTKPIKNQQSFNSYNKMTGNDSSFSIQRTQVIDQDSKYDKNQQNIFKSPNLQKLNQQQQQLQNLYNTVQDYYKNSKQKISTFYIEQNELQKSAQKIKHLQEQQYYPYNNPQDQNYSPSQTSKISFKKSKQLKLKQSFDTTIKRKYIFNEESQQKRKQLDPFCKQLRKSNDLKFRYNDIKSYNWKPGFQEIKDLQGANDKVGQWEEKKQIRNPFAKKDFGGNKNLKRQVLELEDEMNDSNSLPKHMKKLMLSPQDEDQPQDDDRNLNQNILQKPHKKVQHIKLQLNQQMQQRLNSTPQQKKLQQSNNKFSLKNNPQQPQPFNSTINTVQKPRNKPKNNNSAQNSSSPPSTTKFNYSLISQAPPNTNNRFLQTNKNIYHQNNNKFAKQMPSIGIQNLKKKRQELSLFFNKYSRKEENQCLKDSDINQENYEGINTETTTFKKFYNYNPANINPSQKQTNKNSSLYFSRAFNNLHKQQQESSESTQFSKNNSRLFRSGIDDGLSKDKKMAQPYQTISNKRTVWHDYSKKFQHNRRGMRKDDNFDNNSLRLLRKQQTNGDDSVPQNNSNHQNKYFGFNNYQKNFRDFNSKNIGLQNRSSYNLNTEESQIQFGKQALNQAPKNNTKKSVYTYFQSLIDDQFE